MTKVRTNQLAQTGAATNQGLVWNGTEWLPANIATQSLVDAKGDLLAGTAADTLGRLAVGSNTQVLIADSTTATGLKWGPPVDPTKVSLTVFDAAGDLLVGNGPDTVVRLPLGDAGEVLTVVSGNAEWAPLTVNAEDVIFTPFGTIEATNVQAALEELSTEGGSGGGGGGGHLIQDEGVDETQRAKLNFQGDGVSVTDDSINDATIVTITGGGGGGSSYVRDSLVITTASLATNAVESDVEAFVAGYRLYAITTSRAARVRLYTTTAARDADLAREIGSDPLSSAGVMLDYVTAAGALSATLSPLVDGFIVSGTSIPYTVQNLGTTGTVVVTLTYLRTE